jgi:predicted RNase H-like nuclease (RuvC/YqgF family)
MPRSIAEILTELREHVTAEHPMEALVGEVQKAWSEFHQFIFNSGHKKATGQNGEDIRTLERKLTEEQDRVKERDKTIAKLQEKVPDSAALRTEFEERERKLKEEHQKQLDTLTGDLKGERRKGRVQKLIDELTNDVNMVQPDYARDHVDAKYLDRFDFDEKGQPIILQVGQRIPYSATNEDEAIKALAKDIKKSIPSWALRSGAERGGGQQNDGAGGGQKGQPPAELRDKKAATGDYSIV